MEGTRMKILTTIQRNGQATVEGLAHSLELAPATIRRHMDILQRDQLITYREVKKPTGRPEYSFSLTEAGHEVLPKEYQHLLGALCKEMASLEKEELQGKSGKEVMALLLCRIAQRIADSIPVSAGDDLDKRAATLASVLEEGHLMPQVEQEDGGIRIKVFNCPFRSVALEHSSLCIFHSHLISSVLGVKASLEECIARGDPSCSHLAYYGVAPSRVTPAR
ncbi:MAG: transcriptional regulator, TrmB [Dehalococcoidia bacterium]|nr:transcriptional regulator, TrmB [Dehalococcoidia bacterium]